MISTAIFDLETSDLSGDKGIIICGCVKSSTKRGITTIRSDETNPRWYKGYRGDDKETVRQLAEILSTHDVIVAHNGGWFDVPFLRTRLARWGLPRLPDLKLVDPYRIAKNKFGFKSNRLGSIADFIGVKDKKTPLDMSVWMDAMQNGTKASVDLIVTHCIADIKVLEGVLGLVRPYIKILDDRGSDR